MTTQNYSRLGRLAVALSAIVGFWFSLTPPVTLTAQGGVTITSPTASQVLAAGPDYATDVLGDPWDFNNIEDISKDPEQRRGWSGFAMTNGRVGGTTVPFMGNPGSSLTVLERAYFNILNPGRNGAKFPINSSVYSKFSMKMASQRGDQFPQVYWFQNDLGNPSGDASGWRIANTPASMPTPAGNAIAVADLNTSLGGGTAWASAPVRGLMMFANNSATGYAADFDWIRITAGDQSSAAKILPITWSGGSGTSTLQVFDAQGTVFTIASGVSGTSFNFNYGVLPPGQYTLRITRGQSPPSDRTFSINAPPIIHVTDPDETGGEDFATAVLGNPWDMNDGNDVRLEVPGNHLLSPSFSGGFFHAVSDGQAVGFVGNIPIGDPIMYVLANNGLVNTQRYRYLTYSLQLDGVYDLGRGSVSRVFWGSTSGQPYNVTTSKDIIAWPGYYTYTIDLQSLTTGTGGGIESTPNAQTWAAANVRYFRLDPHEFGEQRAFHYDNVKLAAVDEDTNGSFTIRWAVSDANNDPVLVNLYYDTDLNPSNGATLIASNVPGGNGQHVWNTAGIAPGFYYIYAVASDGLNTHGAYSTGPVQIVNFVPATDPLMNLESPAHGSSTGQPFVVSGWAVDRGAPSGTGVDAVHVYAYPNPGSGQAPIFIGSGYGLARSDVGSAFGSRFTNSGFSIAADFLPPGSYQFNAFAHSTVTGSWDTRAAVITVQGGPLLAIEQPADGIAREQPFTLSGWAIDTSSGTGTGVDGVQVWAYPNPGSGQGPIFAGNATYGSARSDVGSKYGGRFTNSGYTLLIRGLPAGAYQFSVFPHSTNSNSYKTWRNVSLYAGNAPRMSVDAPVAGTINRPFVVSGWALDFAAASGTGVDAVQVWAYPTSGASAALVGNATYGTSRPDVGGVFGAQFNASGFTLTVSALAPGTYDLVPFAHSVISNAWDNWRTVRVTVQ